MTVSYILMKGDDSVAESQTNRIKDQQRLLYSQVASEIRNKILARQYESGDKLPTEDELTQQFNVSKITVRRALTILKSEGLIIRNQGKGTFVAEDIDIGQKKVITRNMHDFILDASRYEVPRWDISNVKVGDTTASWDLRAFFSISRDEDICVLKRVRLLEDVPVFYLESYVRPNIGKYLTTKRLSKEPIPKILKDKTGMDVVKGEMYLEIAHANSAVSHALGFHIDDPTILAKIYYWSSEGPLELVYVYTNPEQFTLKVEVIPE